MKTPRFCILRWVILISLLAQPLFSVRAALPAASDAFLTQSTSEAVHFEVTVGWDALSVTPITTESGAYLSVALPDTASTDTVGAPRLPVIGQMVAVPFGVDVDLTIIPGSFRTIKISDPVLPVPAQMIDWQLPTELSLAEGLPDTSLKYEMDPAYYSRNEAYPGVSGKIANDGVIRQQRVVGIALYPVQYNAMKGELLVYESFKVALTFRGSVLEAKSSARPESQEFEAYFSQVLLNYASAKAWRSSGFVWDATASGSSLENEIVSLPWQPPDPGWRIKVTEDGLYRLSYSELEAAGVEVDTLSPQTLRMYHLGEEIAIQVVGEEDESFDSSDSIIFYGQGLDDKYTQDNVYWLTYGGAAGQRMEDRQVGSPDAPLATSFRAETHLEQNVWYIAFVPGGDELERFLWEGIYAQQGTVATFSHAFTLDTAISDSAQLDLRLFGQSTHNEGFKAIVSLNGTQVGVLEWSGQTWGHFSQAVPAGVLLAGNNTLTIALDNTDGTKPDYIYLDWSELTFSSLFQAQSGQLAFPFNLDQPVGFRLEGFGTSDLSLLDITDPRAPVWLSDFIVLPQGGGFNLEFQEGSQVSGQHRYLAIAPSAHKIVSDIQQAEPADLLSGANGADFLIISHTEFLAQAQTLADFRQGQGLRSLVVDVQDIYDLFGFGIVGRDPIQAFLQYAFHHWVAPAPSYLVLLGDGHWNPKGYNPSKYGAWRESFIPPYLAMVDPFLGETAADNRYAAVVGNDVLPEMMVGRMAVTSAAQASAFVDKIIAYESSTPSNDWGTPLLAVADNPDSAGNFAALTQALILTSFPDNYPIERVYLGVTHTNVTLARQAVIAAINNGRFLVNYIGHAANSQWAGYDNFAPYSGPLLAIEDVEGLTNANNYPIISAMTCWEGYYINPHAVGSNYEALSEVITRAEGKGAVATWSPTGMSVATGHDIINRAFFDAIFYKVLPTIGQATQRSVLDLWATGTYLDLVDTFLLFGDPAMGFRRGLTAAPDVYEIDTFAPLIVPAAEGVLTNDLNPQGLPLTALLASEPSSGQVSLQDSGGFTYIPGPFFTGIDSFTYRVSDGTYLSNATTVTIVGSVPPASLFLPLIGK